MYYLDCMFAEMTMCWALECDLKAAAKKNIDAIRVDKFEEFEEERRKKEEFERIFRLLLQEVQRNS